MGTVIAHELPTHSVHALFLSGRDRKSTRLNSSHGYISYAVFCLKKKKHIDTKDGIHQSLPDPGIHPIAGTYLASRDLHYVIRYGLSTARACTRDASRRGGSLGLIH